MATQGTETPQRPYPVRVTAELDPRLSRGLWLIKWLLALPHYVILWFLWIGFAVSSVIAFFAILFAGRFPRRLFDFNVGVMRWTWRVTYYAYGALGTDRYPPFTLSDVPDYPARFDVDYPARLSRRLVMVKWWLLALPHYLVVALFVTGGLLAVGQASDRTEPFFLGGGLIGLLVLIAAVTLLFTGRYPRQVFDLVMGLQRWVLRVAAYAALMTDEYPPFRLDQGGSVDAPEPHSTATQAPSRHIRSSTTDSRGRAVMITGIVLLCLGGVVTIAAGALWGAKKTLPDQDGFFTAPSASCSADVYAITSEPIQLDFGGAGKMTPRSILGDARVTVRSRDDVPVFVGIADTRSARTYLDGVATATMHPERNADDENSLVCEAASGHSPGTAPSTLPVWDTFSEGRGSQTITWPFQQGDWTVVVMNPDGTRGLDVTVDAGATFPGINLAISALLVVAALLLLLGLAMVIGSAAARRFLGHASAQTTQRPKD